MADYSARLDDFQKAGAGLVAISVDNAERADPLLAELEIEFPLLCDTRREVVRAYGLLNERENGGIAFPAAFVIDRNRIVRFRALEDVASRVSVDELLSFVRAVGQGVESSITPRRRGVWPGTMFVRAMMNAVLRGVSVPAK